jgi:hypothetical protein
MVSASTALHGVVEIETGSHGSGKRVILELLRFPVASSAVSDSHAADDLDRYLGRISTESVGVGL